MLILAIIGAVSTPVGHATNNIHTFFTNATTVGTCGILCQGLQTTSGTASTSTVESSIAIGSGPAIDANANAEKTGTWSSATSFTITSLSTTSSPDSILLVVSVNPDTVTVSTTTIPSAPGIIFDSSSRSMIHPSGSLMDLEEWHGIASGTLSAVTVTITLTGTPTSASAEVIAINGAEDPTSTFTVWDKASGYPGTNSQTSGGTSAPTLAAGVTGLNANDLIIGMFSSKNPVTESAGTGFTLDLTVASTASIAVEHKSDTTPTSESCAFGSSTNRWLLICDAYQSAPRYFKVEPETSASLTGTPSTVANGFSGTGWVYNVAGIQNGLFDIQSGTWQIDLTGAVGSTTGTPVARYFVTAWSCTTNSCTTAAFLWKSWDTATNVAGSTTATLRTYTTASQSQITWTSGNFLAFEVWVAWQYSGTTTATTMTETTISTAMDFITPGWDYAQSPSGSLTSTSAFAKMTSMFKSLSGSLSSVSSFVEKTSIFKALAASITLTMGNMVANVNSGQLTCNSSPRSCSTPLTATWNLGSGVARQSSLFRSLGGSLSSASGLAEKSTLFRSLTGSLNPAASETKGLAKVLTGSVVWASGFAEKSSLFRSLSASL